MKYITLTQNKRAKVDTGDYPELSKYRWHLTIRGYASRKKGKKIVSMHREIMRAKQGEEVDHKNLDKLDNRKINLRLCSRSQNRMNIPKFNKKRGHKEFKGTNIKFGGKKIKRWYAQITIKGKKITKGMFLTELEAAHKYNELAVRYFGEFARLNKI